MKSSAPEKGESDSNSTFSLFPRLIDSGGPLAVFSFVNKLFFTFFIVQLLAVSTRYFSSVHNARASEFGSVETSDHLWVNKRRIGEWWDKIELGNTS
jgi:hypothetical protein